MHNLPDLWTQLYAARYMRRDIFNPSQRFRVLLLLICMPLVGF